MAEKHAEPAAAEPAGKPKSSMIGKLVVLGVIVAVIGGECLMAALYLPSVAASAPAKPAEPADAADHAAAPDEHAAEEHADHGADRADSHSKDPSHDSHAQQREVDLGEFSLTAFQPASNSTLLIDFHLYGTVNVDPKEAEAAHEDSGGHGHGKGEAKPNDAFSKLYDKCKHRIRDQVITIVRSAEMTDFADPSLGLIRRKILEKSNRALGKPLLTEVIFSDFSLVEQ